MKPMNDGEIIIAAITILILIIVFASKPGPTSAYEQSLTRTQQIYDKLNR